jgi:aerobic-type carbon monoxide dehydrogenase small subunit (CoxS/CutS family)
MRAIVLTVNNQAHAVEVAPATPLLWVLRDVLHLTGPTTGVASCSRPGSRPTSRSVVRVGSI